MVKKEVVEKKKKKRGRKPKLKTAKDLLPKGQKLISEAKNLKPLMVPKATAGVKSSLGNLKSVVDNAPKIQQVEFWKEAAVKCRKQMEEHKKVWVSAHGLGVPYFHLRIATKPKYYFDEELSKA